MKPGREMDALVALYVMDWEFDVPANRGGECQNCGGRWGDAPSHGRRKPLDNEWYRWCDGNACRYSTSDDAAWAVVRAMHDKGWRLWLFPPHDDALVFTVHFAKIGGAHRFAQAQTFAEAVCVAALRALGVEP